MNQHLHIICSGVPWPADCGISKDIFYRIEAFYKNGKRIHLHYFCGSEHRHPNELNKYCESICMHRSGLDLEVFDQDEFPILLEGARQIDMISSIAAKGRNIVVRLHECYYELPNSLGQFKIFSFSKRSKEPIKKLPNEYAYACMNQNDVEEYKRIFDLQKIIHIPAFISLKNVCCCEGVGSFCLYYADLSIPANEKAVIWLLTKVFNGLEIPFVIAGKNPSERLNKLAHFYQHACLVNDPTPDELNDLISKAQIIIIPSFDKSTSSYNLVESLFAGRHCITNEPAVKYNKLRELCHIAKTSGQFKSLVKELFQRPLQKNEIGKRKEVLVSMFNNERSVEQLSEYLW